MSLAEELLADLEEDGFDDEPMIIPEETPHELEENALIPKQNDFKNAKIRDLAKLRDSERLMNIMQQIYIFQSRQRKTEDELGPVESDPEYLLIVEANNLIVEMDDEILIIHKFVRDKYSKRFPELESLVVGPLEYVQTVKELGNTLEQSKNNEVLPTFLTQATIMVVSVTASTTQG